MIVYTDKGGVPFQIDEADYGAVSRYCWYIDSEGYPATTIGKKPRQRAMRLHKFLLGRLPAGREVDHRDRDRLNNQRHNLLVTTHAANMQNTVQARKTHCKRGHEYTLATVYYTRAGLRQCRPCHAERQRRLNRERKPEAGE